MSSFGFFLIIKVYVNKDDLVNAIRQHPNYPSIKDNLGRNCLDLELVKDCFSCHAQNKETIESVLTRISET